MKIGNVRELLEKNGIFLVIVFLCIFNLSTSVENYVDNF